MQFQPERVHDRVGALALGLEGIPFGSDSRIECPVVRFDRLRGRGGAIVECGESHRQSSRAVR